MKVGQGSKSRSVEPIKNNGLMCWLAGLETNKFGKSRPKYMKVMS